MDPSVKLIVHRGSIIFDSINVTPNAAIRYEKRDGTSKSVEGENTNNDTRTEKKTTNVLSLRKKGCNAYFASAYIFTIIESDVYRRAAVKKLLELMPYTCTDAVGIVLIKLRTPKKQFLDYCWNDRLTQITLEKREIDHAMSWLSTLGGAFSALGEEFESCAEMAGKISLKQFEFAMRLGDPLLVARCKLYAALSLIQRGKLRIPREIVKNVYKQAIAENDTRLENMCQGIWAKLQYCNKVRKERRKKI